MTAIIREVTIGPCRLIQGDCLEVLPLIGRVDAVVTDPPYGIGASSMSFGMWRTSAMEKGVWDEETPDLSSLVAMGVPTIIWGGNYFALPPSRRWLIWDKGAGFRGRDFAECEMAWCSFDGNARVLTHDPLARGDYRDKQHPTQKPVGVMQWCLSHLPSDAETILDPFMGSGTTGVACIKTGRQFIGIEKEPKYFDIAVSRIRRAWQDKCSEIKFDEPEPLRQLELV